MNDFLYGVIGFVVSGFQFAIGAMCRIGFVVKLAVGQRATEAFVEEQEQERHLNAFCCEAVSVTVLLAIQQAMAFEFAEIVAELVQPVRLRRELEGGEDGGVNLFGSPTADGVAPVQENLQ